MDNIDYIKKNTDIIKVISDSGVKLIQDGTEFKGLCPFHVDKNKSLSVSVNKKLYHCFGCNAGGDVITYIQKYKNCSFNDAAKFLAENYNLNTINNNNNIDKPKALRLLADHQNLYRDNLSASTLAANYILRTRKISTEMVDLYKIGFCIENKQDTENTKTSYNLGLHNKAGWLFFNNRVTLPYLNANGDVVGFFGRSISDEKIKVLNSKNTNIFDKSKTLFGLYQVVCDLPPNIKAPYIFVVEGVIDCVMMRQFGFKNVVALSGTKSSECQAKILKKYTNNIIICMDGDKPGFLATKNIILNFAENFNVKIITIPDNSDPDSFLRSHAKKEFVELFSAKKTAKTWIIDYIKQNIANILNSDKKNKIQELCMILK